MFYIDVYIVVCVPRDQNQSNLQRALGSTTASQQVQPALSELRSVLKWTDQVTKKVGNGGIAPARENCK